MTSEKHRITLRCTEDDYQTMAYWAKRNDISINEFVLDAIDHYIRFLNKDFDVPNMTIQRMNQLVDVIAELSSDVHSLEDMTQSGFDSLLSLTRGDSSLLNIENEE